METKEFKKVTKYNARAINEFVKEQNIAKEEFDNTIPTLDAKIEEFNNKLEELKSKNTRKMTETEKEEHKAEKEKYKTEKKNVEREKKQAEKYLDKFEKERERIKGKLAEKVGKIEAKIEENKAKIEELENEIKENEEKMEGIEDKESTEYKELLKANADASKKISSSKGNITKYTKKIEDIKEIEGNLDTWNVVDLPEIIDIKSKPRSLSRGKTFKKVSKESEKQNDTVEPEVTETEQSQAKPKVQQTVKQAQPLQQTQLAQSEQPKKQAQPVQQKEVAKTAQPEQVKQQPVQSKQPAQTEEQQPVQDQPKQEQPEQKLYSEMTLEELEKKQRELFAKIVEGDDYYWRAHHENGMEGHEEDWLDKELKAVKEEIDKRKVVSEKQTEPTTPNEPEEAKKVSLFEKIKEFFKKVINSFSKKDIKLLPEDTLTVSLSVDGNNERKKFVKEIRVNVGELMNAEKDSAINELLEREEETR